MQLVQTRIMVMVIRIAMVHFVVDNRNHFLKWQQETVAVFFKK
jgi:hypothetical protein